ncbi:MAG: hypothetical protein WC889_11980, partial [Myxococcota bacterium]
MNVFKLHNEAMTVTVDADVKVAELERFLRAHGLTLGEFQPPVGHDAGFSMADWIADPLIPAQNYDGALT